MPARRRTAGAVRPNIVEKLGAGLTSDADGRFDSPSPSRSGQDGRSNP
jgi:hypothetical protein